jgi:hypothetical protein
MKQADLLPEWQTRFAQVQGTVFVDKARAPYTTGVAETCVINRISFISAKPLRHIAF